MVSEPAGSLDPGGRPNATLRRLIWVVGAVVFIDTMFYSVISPMLPQLSHHFGLSKLSAGVLTACYPAGTLLAALPGGALAAKLGPRTTVCTGLALLIVSTLGFALLGSALGLDVARFVEGVAGACTWAGGLAWLAGVTGGGRRGEMVGKAFAAGVAGALLGPALGASADAIGRPGLFIGLAAVAFMLIPLTRRLPDETPGSGQGLGVVIRAMRSRPILRGSWLVALPAIVAGMVTVLGSLRLHQFGASAVVIGATFFVGAGVESVISAPIGRFSDRHGRMLPLRAGAALMAVVTLLFTVPHAVIPLGLLIVVLDVCLGLFWTPGMALMADVGDTHGLDQAHAAALMNLAWAAGQILGAAGGGGVAKAFGDLPVTVCIAVMSVLTLILLRRDGERQRGGCPDAQAQMNYS